MKNLILFMVMCMAVIACTTRNGYTSELNRVQEIINDSPKKALELTQEIKKKGGLNKSQEMRCLLLNMQAQDKIDAPVSSEEDAIRCVEFYEANGSNNDKALAYYLLGCVYRDMHDAPTALENYLKAVNVADTTGSSVIQDFYAPYTDRLEIFIIIKTYHRMNLKPKKNFRNMQIC